MKTQSPQTIFLKDYRPPQFLIETVDLHIDLAEEWTTVKAQLNFCRNPASNENSKTLVLNGQKMELLAVSLDTVELTQDQYQVDESHLTITDVPDNFVLSTEVRIKPQNNTELEGLYKSSKLFCTQCESEGFRKITYFLDRPDVMSLYSTTISADPQLYPVMLSNGNLRDSGKLTDGRHWVKWEDPFPKPAYLFALVAGDLLHIEDSFRTSSGRKVKLQIYVEAENIEFCDHAMLSLKESMRWDEERFGREYDLDLFMIVAVNDFNMGAMENKGLNIFNSKLILASQETATDTDFYNIQGVVGHEYFHNWSGNRVTCRDWFQLSLKEGFTVFRDQEFSSDLNSRAVQRIADADRLRVHQFPEDAGPMSHPIRPDSYMEINNFYTMTVYEKGAEVVRMIYTLLGRDNFRKGTDLYFERHDGQAVTCDNFVAAMEDANGVDFQQFRRWYSQSGTPELHISGSHDPETKTYSLTVQQSCPDTAGQKGFGTEFSFDDGREKQITPVEIQNSTQSAHHSFQKQPFHIPLALGLFAADGSTLPLKLTGGTAENFSDTIILELRKQTETFVFEDVSSAPVPSLLRGFSAPVKLHFDYSNADLAFLLANDTDEFNRWEAGQQLMIRISLEQIRRFQNNESFNLPPELENAFRSLLNQTEEGDSALLALALSFPNEPYLGEFMDIIDVEAIHKTRKFLRTELAQKLQPEFENTYINIQREGTFKIDPQSMGRRSLKNVCLSYLSELGGLENRKLAQTQFRKNENMTDVAGALGVLTHLDCEERESAFVEFENRWQKNTVVMDKWFALQAISSLPKTLENVRALTKHPSYEKNNPNKIRALISTFSRFNQLRFHAKDGSGYEFLAEQVLRLDPINPQTAARLVSVFNNWKNFAVVHKTKMNDQLQRIIKTPNLSGDTFEIVSKALG
ncbi:MAG: aminopeptidase N [SAR324 cluster bacterium]|nr:aminopeptidase N [SAR324 cluster bacterium]